MSQVIEIPLRDIMLNRYYIRRTKNVEELAQDIKIRGLINPITVRPISDGDGKKYEIAQGERRFLAYQKLGYDAIPAQIRSFDSEADFLSFTIAENIKRRNLTWLELGEALLSLLDNLALTQKDISKIIGLDYNYIRQVTSVIRRIDKETIDEIYKARPFVKREGAYEIISWNNVQSIFAKERGNDERANRIIRDTIQNIIEHDISFDDAYPLAVAVRTEEEKKKVVEIAKEHEVPVAEVAKVAEELGVDKARKIVERASTYKPEYKEKPDIRFWVAVEKEASDRLSDIKRSVETVESRAPKELSKDELQIYQRLKPLDAAETVRKFIDDNNIDISPDKINLLFDYEEWRRKNKLKIEGKEYW